METYVVSDGASSFYAPEDQIEAWEKLGFSIYKEELVPVSQVEKTSDSPSVATATTGIAPRTRILSEEEANELNQL